MPISFSVTDLTNKHGDIVGIERMREIPIRKKETKWTRKAVSYKAFKNRVPRKLKKAYKYLGITPLVIK